MALIRGTKNANKAPARFRRYANGGLIEGKAPQAFLQSSDDPFLARPAPRASSVVPENPDLNDKVGFAFTPSILARLRILSALRVPFWVVPQPCRPPT